MHANIVTVRYKSSDDLDAAATKLEQLAEQALPRLPGFDHFTLLRTGDAETTHVVRFDSERHAADARQEMLPRLRELIAGHAAGDPDVRTGPILYDQ